MSSRTSVRQLTDLPPSQGKAASWAALRRRLRCPHRGRLQRTWMGNINIQDKAAQRSALSRRIRRRLRRLHRQRMGDIQGKAAQ